MLAFTVEMLIAGTGIRDEVVQTQRSALPRLREEATEAEAAPRGGEQRGASGGAG